MRRMLLVAASALALGACSSWQADVAKESYSVSTQRIGAEPQYARTRYALPPVVIPASPGQGASQPSESISPVLRFEIKNGTLDEAAAMLRATSRYRSYVASSVAARRLTLDTLGTLDELAVQIGRASGAKVIVDHDNREIRFLAGSGDTAPRFYEGQRHESQSYY